MKKPKKPNNDRKQLCKKCKYRGLISVGITKIPGEIEPRIMCDYIGITGHPRIKECDDPAYCTVFKQGKPKRVKPLLIRNK